jgi:glutamate-1-semialdehyde 2,1-aminomutase
MLFTAVDIEVAEKIEHYIPCADKVKFCVTGTEAVQVAIRLARAYTGRKYFIRFGGHYHGWMDNVLGGVGDQDLYREIREGKGVSRKPFPISSPDDFVASEGRDLTALEQVFVVPWNDIEVLEKVLQAYGNEVAMIQCEAIPANYFCVPPLPGFLERVRELCDQYGIVLSFDEIITGFRTGLGGIQKELNVIPDIAVLGKAMASGIPCSAVVGKEEIMDLIRQRRVISPGTYMGYPFGLAATLATINVLEQDDGAVYREFDRLQDRLTTGLRAIAKRHGHNMVTQGCRGVFYTLFTADGLDAVRTDAEVAQIDMAKMMKFWTEMAKEGALAAPYARWYLCTAHTDADIDRTLEVAERAIRNV